MLPEIKKGFPGNPSYISLELPPRIPVGVELNSSKDSIENTFKRFIGITTKIFIGADLEFSANLSRIAPVLLEVLLGVISEFAQRIAFREIPVKNISRCSNDSASTISFQSSPSCSDVMPFGCSPEILLQLHHHHLFVQHLI